MSGSEREKLRCPWWSQHYTRPILCSFAKVAFQRTLIAKEMFEKHWPFQRWIKASSTQVRKNENGREENFCRKGIEYNPATQFKPRNIRPGSYSGRMGREVLCIHCTQALRWRTNQAEKPSSLSSATADAVASQCIISLPRPLMLLC